ncbi:MAG TPA: amidohydrolase family protein [Terriglobales bacterium]|jgi:imidazolonepropionase-like amidohydrolase
MSRPSHPEFFLVKTVVLTLILWSPAFAQDPSSPASPNKTMAIVGGTLIDVHTGEEIQNSVILVRGQRVLQVGVAGKQEIPRDAEIVDAHGKWIIPGLIDMHAHVSMDDSDQLPLRLYLANGVTTVRDPGGYVTLSRMLKEHIEAGRRIGPRVFFCGNILDGKPPVFPSSSLLADTPERARSAVTFLADQGVDCIKVYNNVKEPELKVIIATARARNLPVIGHVPRTITMTHAVELGMQSLEHIRITGRELLPLDEANKIDPLPLGKRETLLWQQFDVNSEKMQQLVSFLAKQSVALDPTLTVDEATFVQSRDDEINNPNNRYLPPQLFEKWKQEPEADFENVPAELKQADIEGFEKRKTFIAMCARAGVRIIAGTDGAYWGTLLPGFGLHHELQLLVQSGLTPLKAIQAATLNSAKTLGKEHELGQVAPGYFADIVILEADPLKQVENATKISLVMKAGQIYRPADLMKGPGVSQETR